MECEENKDSNSPNESANSSPFNYESETRSTVSGSFSQHQWSTFSSTEFVRMEGYLQKKQNKWPNLYNKRYFKLTPNGERLLYFNDEPKEGERPSAAIDLKKVKDIVKKPNKHKLELLYENRNFVLKAKTEEERDAWVECLQSAKRLCGLKSSSVKSSINLKKQPSIRRQATLSKSQTNLDSRKQDHKFENLPNSVVAQILEESPEILGHSLENQRDNKFLINKGVLRYASKVDKEKLNARMIYGSFDKRSKGNVKYWMKRWLLLVSSRPLKADLYVEDDYIMEETNFPVWLEFDVIYYFKEEGEDDDSPNIGEIPLSKVVRVEDKDMSQSRDKGTKKYHFNTKHKYEMDRWLEAIELSSRTVQERQMSITGQNKNISKIIQQYEEDNIAFEENLLKNVEAHFSAQKNQNQFDQVIENCTDLADSLVAIFDACLAQKPPNHDLLQLYMETQHTKMIKFLGDYWEKNAVNLSVMVLTNTQAFQVLTLMEWTQNYTEKLQKFGIQDDEVRNGNLALCNAYTSKISEKIIPTIANILEHEREAAPQVNIENGSLFTNAAHDIFKLFSESIEVARAKGFKDLVKQTIKLLNELIGQYQEALHTIIERFEIHPSKRIHFLIAVLNNTLIFNQLQRRLAADLESPPSPLTDEEIASNFKIRQINKKFSCISGIARRQIIDYFFTETQIDKQFVGGFAELQIREMQTVACQIFTETVTKFINPVIEQSLWVMFLERMVKNYVQCFFNCSTKLKQKGLEGVVKLIKDHCETLEQIFKDEYVNEASYDSLMEVVHDIQSFLESSADFISIPCRKLAEAHGKAFKLNILKALLALRTDLSKEERADILKGCREILELYATTSSQSLLSQISTAHVEGGDGEDLNSTGTPKTQGDEIDFESFLKMGGVVLDELNGDGQNKNEEAKRESVSEDYDISGELLKKSKFKEKTADSGGFDPGSFLTKKLTKQWQKRFVQIKGNNVYWYNDKKSKESRNHLELKNVTNCYKRKERQFVLVLKSEKCYCFKAQDSAERDQWIEAIEKKREFIAKNDPTNPDRYKNVKVFEKVSDCSMFKDYIALKEKSEREQAQRLYRKSKLVTQSREPRFKRRESVLQAVSPLKISKNKSQQKSRSPSPINGLHYKSSGILSKSMTMPVKSEETKRGPPAAKFEIEDGKTTHQENTDDFDTPTRGGCGSCFFGIFGFGKKKKNQKKNHPAVDHGQLVGH